MNEKSKKFTEKILFEALITWEKQNPPKKLQEFLENKKFIEALKFTHFNNPEKFMVGYKCYKNEASN